MGQSHHFNAYARERIPLDQIQYAIDRYVNEGNRVYGVIERRLDGREWIAADEYTIADMAIMPWLRDPAKQGIDIANYPNLERWRDKIWQRPQVVKALETLADDRRHLVVRADLQELGFELVALADVDGMHRPFEAALLEHDVNLVPVGRGPRIAVDHLPVLSPISSMRRRRQPASN